MVGHFSQLRKYRKNSMGKAAWNLTPQKSSSSRDWNGLSKSQAFEMSLEVCTGLGRDL